MLSINILWRHVNDHVIHNTPAHSIQHKQMVLQQFNYTRLLADAILDFTL